MPPPVFAGHAGELEVPVVFPHEIMGGIALLAGIGVVLMILAAVGLWLLIRIDRRLRAGSPTRHESTPPAP